MKPVFFHAIVCALVAFFSSCSSTQTVLPDGAVIVTPSSWVATGEVALHVLQSELPNAATLISALPGDPVAKAAALESINVAEGSLPGLEQALAQYGASPTNSNRCIARAAIALTAASILAVADGLAAVGFLMPAAILVAVGGLGTLVDELMPACVVDAGASAAPMGPTISARLAALPHNLRPFPTAAR